MSGEQPEWMRVDYLCRTEVNSSSTPYSESIVPWIDSEPDYPPKHRSYPSNSKRKENATVKSGVLWRSFDFKEAPRHPLLIPGPTNQYGAGRFPTKSPGKNLLDNGYRTAVKVGQAHQFFDLEPQRAGSAWRDLQQRSAKSEGL